MLERCQKYPRSKGSRVSESVTGADPVDEGTVGALTKMTLCANSSSGTSIVGKRGMPFRTIAVRIVLLLNSEVTITVARDLCAASHADVRALFCSLHDM